MSAQRVKLSTEMQFLQDALKSGRATLQKFSMKQLRKLDQSMQPRVIHLNMDHVKNLGDILQVQIKMDRDLDPGVLFRDPATGWVGLVDGWHRLKAYQVARLDYFPAYVIEGTKDEAIEYAAMANQHAMLRRTPADIEKQLGMLFCISKWWNRSNQMIGFHVGVHGTTVGRYRAKYSQSTGLRIPDEYSDINGRNVARTSLSESLLPGKPRARIRQESDGRFRANLFGEQLNLGRQSREEAEKILNEKLLEIKETKSTRVNFIRNNLQKFLSVRGLFIHAISVGSNSHGICGFSGHGRTIARSILTKVDTSARDAIGTILALREHDNPAHRAVVVCYPEDGPEEILDLGRRLGIEFLTPEQLVASIKADGQAGPPEDDDGLDSVKVQTVEQFLEEVHAEGDDSDDTQAPPSPSAPDSPDGGAEVAQP